MCGFVAIRGRTDKDELAAMLAPLARRGPDGEGFWLDEDFGCAHRRLAVVGADARGAQPMEREGIVVVFNGCIYNYPQLARKLEREGVRLASRTDTEVLPYLYRRYGEAFVDKLDGMFAFVLWDRRNRKLVAARDRFGEKPLVFAHQGRRWLFASTLDALARAEGMRLTLRAEALEQLIRTMRIPAPATIYREAWALPAGTMLVIDGESQAKAFRWADDFPKEVNSLMDFDEAVHEAMRALDASVRRRLIGDRPLGVFLSGGVDSSLIAESAMRAAGHVRTFSVRFAGAEGGFDESAYAAEVARAIGAEHEVLDVRPQALEALEELAEALDQPLGNSTALPMLLLARTARAHTVVALHGVGGDELFAGYPRHFGFVWHAMLHRAIGWPVWGKLAARMADAADARNLRGRIRRWLAALSDPPARAYRRWLAAWDEADVPIVELEAQPSAPPVPLPDPLAEGGGLEAWLERLDPLHAAMLYDVREYLAHDLLVLADRTTMHWGLELRAPFLCPRLYQLAFAAHFRLHLSPWHPERGLKRLLKAVAQRRLPKSVWARPKQGFMLPIRQWFAGELAGEVAGLAAPKGKLAGLVRLDFRRRVVGEHQSGRDRSDVLWTLLLLEAWLVRRGLV